MKCKHMGNSGICYILSTADHFEHCVQGPCPHEAPMTNADRIRAMSDEELAKIIVSDCLDERLHFCQNKSECDDILERGVCVPEERCVECVLDWLSQPEEED